MNHLTLHAAVLVLNFLYGFAAGGQRKPYYLLVMIVLCMLLQLMIDLTHGISPG